MNGNSTLEAVTALLQSHNPELQMAAVRVLGAIKVQDDNAVKTMGELLVRTPNPDLRVTVIDVFAELPHPVALRYLVQSLTRDPGTAGRVLQALANAGAAAVTVLRQQFDSLPMPVRRQAVAILPLIRTPEAHKFFVELCFSPDHELVRNSLRALREAIGGYQSKELADLRADLAAALQDARSKPMGTALSAIIIALGIAGQVADKKLLLPYLHPDYPIQLRRHALMSLANFNYSGAKHQDVFDAVLPILKEKEYEELVRHAVQVLSKISVKRSDNDQIKALLSNPHSGVKVYAIQTLSHLDSITNATTIADLWYASRDSKIRDAAVDALRRMPSAAVVILRKLDEVRDRASGYELVNILESHASRIDDAKAGEMVDKMLTFYHAQDERYQLYRTALCHLRPHVLQQRICALAAEQRKAKKWAELADTLHLIDHTELMTPDLRFDLAVALLKNSKQARTRAARQSDTCLEHFALLLQADEKNFAKKFVACKSLTVDDLFYVGFHFAEQLNAERRFGLDVLKAVIAKSPKSETAKLARQKLKTEGH